MSQLDDHRGILFPERLPLFHREPAPPRIRSLVRWFWIPVWNLADGDVSLQEVLPYPASNLVIERGGVSLAGPTTRASTRELRGSGWAVGALLRPAGTGVLWPDPRHLRDAEAVIVAPELHRQIVRAMQDPADPSSRRHAVAAFSDWLAARSPGPTDGGLAANAMEDAISADRGLTRIEHVAERIGTSVRTVQRLSRRYIGLPPSAVIRRYRLQDAAQRLREDPRLTISAVAAELGYADHAHLTADFRSVLGRTPRTYRGS